MAMTNAEVAKSVSDTLKDSKGHTQGRNRVKVVTHTEGQSTITVLFRSGETKTLTIS